MGILGLLLLLAAPGFWAYVCLDRAALQGMAFAEKLTFILGTSIVITTLYTVALMVLGLFSPLLVFAPYVLLVLYLLISRKRALIYEGLSLKIQVRHTWKAGMGLLLLLLFAALYFQPAEYFVGGRDPGIYVNTALQISRHHDIMREAPLLSEVRTSYPGVFEDHFVKFPGIYIQSSGDTLKLNPQFYHGYSIWLGLAHQLLGMDFFLWISPLFGMIALLVFYTAVRTMLDRRTALIAALLLGLNISQIWYARSPYTEVLSQILLWFGVYLTLLANRHKRVLLGIIVGLCLNAAILVRLDAVFSIPAFGIFLLLLCIRPNGASLRWIAGVVGAFAAGFLITGAYILKYGREYTHFQLIRNIFLPDTLTLPALFFILLTAGMILLLFIYLLRRPLGLLLDWMDRHHRVLCALLSVVVTAGAAYLFFMRPGTDTPHLMRTGIRSYREETLVRLGWYTTRLGLAGALGGLLLLINATSKKAQSLFLLLTALNFALYLYDPKIFPDHFWAVRRHVPFILPALFVMAAFLISKAGALRIRFLKPWMLPAALTVFFCVRFLAAAQPFLQHIDFQGVREGLDYTAEHFTDQDIIITNDVQFISRLVGTPLQFKYDKQVLVLREQYDDNVLSQFIRNQRAGGRQVYLLIGTAYQDLQNPYVSYLPLKPLSFDYRVARSTELYRPNEVITRRVSMYLYEAFGENLYSGSTEIDVGAPQDIHFRYTGFFGSEGIYPKTYRWAMGSASVRLLGDFRALPGSSLRLNVYGWRLAGPKGELPPVVVYINGQEAGSLHVGTQADVHSLTFSKAMLTDPEALEIGLSTTAYTPKALGLNEDLRELGFAIGTISIESEE